MTAFEVLVDQLSDKRSSVRRSAAKKLRKSGAYAAGAPLLAALANELKDERTWETQYQMIMAIGEIGYKEAFPLIQILAHERFKATTVLIAVGDAYIRLSISSNHDSKPIFEILSIDNSESLYDGALRAVAMLRMNMSEADVNLIIANIVDRKSERLKFWLAAACAGCSGPTVESFLIECRKSSSQAVRGVAEDAIKKKYRKWNIL